MPTNKNALLRYKILDKCLGDYTKKYSFDDLLDEVNETLFDIIGKNTSVRTLREDLRFMSDRMTYNAPIKTYPYEGRKSYYRYSDRNYSIFKNELNIDEISMLSKTIETLSRFKGQADFYWIEETLNTLECKFGFKPNAKSLISFDHNELLHGLKYLSTVIDATIYHHSLNIHYLSYKNMERVFVFFPYYVKQYNNRWFVFGKTHGFVNITNIALDRIQNISISEIPFEENEEIDFNTYFDDIIGVTIPSDKIAKEDVVLKVSRERFPYVLSKPIHSSQIVIDNEECTLKLSLRPNKELKQQIFSFGADMEVIQPMWLRDEIIEEIQENLKKYLAVQKDCTNV